MRLLTLALAIFLLAAPALASDGVLEINDACALNGGCFSGDSSGYPITITAAGAYRLTSNLNVPSNVTAIDIAANAVTLDLGGFTIAGTNVCTGSPVTSCTTINGNPGIRAVGQYGISVRNGSVIGMGGAGISLYPTISALVEEVLVVNNGWDGITLGAAGRVIRCRIGSNLQTGIFLGGPGGLAERNDVHANGYHGVMAADGSEIVGNQLVGNGQGGANVGASRMSANVTVGNGFSLFGISMGDNLCVNAGIGTKC